MQDEFDRPLEKCALCGSSDIVFWRSDFAGRAIFHCRGCRIRFLNPQYSDAHLQRLYSGYAVGESPDLNGISGDEERARKRAENQHFYFDLVERYIRPGRFLSVGCGDGFDIGIARDRGWEAEGYEVDPNAVTWLQEKGLTIHAGEFSKIEWGSRRYDCIYLHHVLEHVKNPQDYLQTVQRLLTPTGIAFIASPNVASLSNRFKDLRARLGVQRRPLVHYDTWHHIFFFTPRGLKRLIESHYGFEVLLTHIALDAGDHGSTIPDTVTRRLGRFTSLKSKFLMLCRAAGTPHDSQ